MDYENDYVILIDENGQPYLAHSAVGDKIRGAMSTINRKVRNNVGKGNRYNYKEHKYLEKVPNYFPNGRALYLYTQDEVDAFHGRNGNKKGSRTLSNRIRDRLGFDERIERDEARAAKSSSRQGRSKEADDALNRAQDAYSKTALGRLENLGSSVRNTTLKAIRGAKNAGRKAAQWVDDHDAGLSETATYALKRGKVDQDERDRLHDEMVNSGRIGQLANRIGESDTAHRITNAAYNPGQTARNAANSVGTAARNVATSAKEATQNINDSINNIVDTYITGASANAGRQQALQDAAMGLQDASARYLDYQQQYEKSLASKTEGARGALNTTVAKARDGLIAAQAAVDKAFQQVARFISKEDAAALQAELNANMGLDGSIGEFVDTHK